MSGTRRLELRFHGRVLEHLGIQIYQSPVNSLAELVANAWDAEATEVRIALPTSTTAGAITIEDNGVGMTFDACQKRFLNVGWNRREDDPEARTSNLKRHILGRKGIGKFAGFGIAGIIRVDTTSRENGERTVFELHLDALRQGEYINERAAAIAVLEYEDPCPNRAAQRHGTTITLSQLTLKRLISREGFPKSLARRFLLQQAAAEFRIYVSNVQVPTSADFSKAEYAFPKDYREGEAPAGLTTVDADGWGTETVDGNEIRWRFLFHKEPIADEELRGIAVFAGEKLAQAPFFFNLSGGLSGQHGLEYLSGQVRADFIDSLAEDLIATERQRVNWEHDATAPLRDWGQQRIKSLISIWRDRRGEDRERKLESKVEGFSQRLDKLPKHESKTVKTALRKLAQVPALADEQFEDLGDAMLTAWEHGRLRELITDLSKPDSLSDQQFLTILVESEVLTALNVAEAVKTKLLTVVGLRDRVKKRDLENTIRDYIADHPELISPEFETFRKERGVKKLMEDAARDAKLIGSDWDGRTDLSLSSGQQLLVLEFMRPGLTLDWDHISRFERYVVLLREAVAAQTGGLFNYVSGYIVADNVHKNREVAVKAKKLAADGMFVHDWEALFSRSAKIWDEFLKILASRAKDDRLRALL